jgi:hypothetical protein
MKMLFQNFPPIVQIDSEECRYNARYMKQQIQCAARLRLKLGPQMVDKLPGYLQLPGRQLITTILEYYDNKIVD